MKKVLLTAASLNVTPFDWAGNEQKFKTVLVRVQKQKTDAAKVVLFPELSICGPGCGDWLNSPMTVEYSLNLLGKLLPETKGLIAVFGLPLSYHEKVYSAAAVVSDEKLLGFFCRRLDKSSQISDSLNSFAGSWEEKEEKKITLFFDDDGFHGKDFFEERSKILNNDNKEGLNDLKDPQITINKEEKPSFSYAQYPIGKDVWNFDFGSVKIAEGSENSLDRDGKITKKNKSEDNNNAVDYADILLLPCMNSFEFKKRDLLRNSLMQSSYGYKAVAYANLCGNESGSLIYDGASALLSSGEILIETPRFSYADVETVSLLFGDEEKPLQKISLPSWERAENVVYEELARAVPLALFDYMRKSGSNGFTLSLSGGADSGAIAVMIRLMIENGLENHRKEFLEKLQTIPGVARLLSEVDSSKITPDKLTAALLTTIYQATSSSGPVTKNASKKLAESIHSVHYEINIDHQTESYKELISAVAGRKLSWETDDLALQNIQARVRAPGVWLLANLNGSLLLSTGNRSEAAVGYATMDGDTCGGLSPIGDIDKAFLLRWLRWMEKTGPQQGHSFPILKLINEQAPTAELRPGGKQTDEGDLMPYPVLECFWEMLVCNRFSALLAHKKLLSDSRLAKFHFSAPDLLKWQIRFYKRWTASQWKRERFAPCFHLGDLTVTSKNNRQFPILSGGFQNEIAELEKALRCYPQD